MKTNENHESSKVIAILRFRHIVILWRQDIRIYKNQWKLTCCIFSPHDHNLVGIQTFLPKFSGFLRVKRNCQVGRVSCSGLASSRTSSELVAGEQVYYTDQEKSRVAFNKEAPTSHSSLPTKNKQTRRELFRSALRLALHWCYCYSE